MTDHVRSRPVNTTALQLSDRLDRLRVSYLATEGLIVSLSGQELELVIAALRRDAGAIANARGPVSQ